VAEAAAPVDKEDEEEPAVEEERYALGGACRVLAGMPAPLGATALAGGVNFAVYSGDATAAALCLFTPDDLKAVGFASPVLEFTIPCALFIWSAV
jgi:isoamylase